MILKELLDVVCWDTLKIFGRDEPLFPPLKGILETDEDHRCCESFASLDGQARAGGR
jgi:hypothetical protein